MTLLYRTRAVVRSRSASALDECVVYRPVRSPRRWRRSMVATLFATLALAPAIAHADGTDYWNGGNGTWDVAANWSAGAPDANYAARPLPFCPIPWLAGIRLISASSTMVGAAPRP